MNGNCCRRALGSTMHVTFQAEGQWYRYVYRLDVVFLLVLAALDDATIVPVAL